MPLQALRTVAKAQVCCHAIMLHRNITNAIAQNGVGAFILQCKRLDFHYCDWAGSSRGMKYDI
jgi:large subunit ribosomal protein L43